MAAVPGPQPAVANCWSKALEKGSDSARVEVADVFEPHRVVGDPCVLIHEEYTRVLRSDRSNDFIVGHYALDDILWHSPYLDGAAVLVRISIEALVDSAIALF